MAGWAMAYPVWGTTCHQITSRVGGKMWTPWCVELKSHAYHFVFVSVFVYVFVFDLSSGTLRSRVVGVRYVHPGVQLESHAYHLSQPGGRGGATPCRAVKHYLSPQVTQIDCYHPRHPFHRQHDHLDHRRCECDHLERRECEEDLIVIRCGGAPDTPVILLLIPSDSNLNWIYPTYASSW